MKIEYKATDKNGLIKVFKIDFKYTQKENDTSARHYVMNYMDLSNEPYTVNQTGFFYCEQLIRAVPYNYKVMLLDILTREGADPTTKENEDD